APVDASLGPPTPALDVDRRQLSRQTYEALRAMSFRGEVAPGQKLVPRDLARSIGVSITPIRDAINLLATEGLVTVSPRRGTVVPRGARNDRLDAMSEAVFGNLMVVRTMILPRSFDAWRFSRGRGVHADHQAILDALTRRDAAAARQAMARHLESARDDLLGYI